MTEQTKPGTSPAPGLHIMGAMLTDVGMVRPHNEDAVMYRIPDPADSDAKLGMLAVVADGMGGHAAGEVASQIATRAFHTLYYESDLPVPDTLARGFAAANLVIRQQASLTPEFNGMGTTCTVLAARDGHIWLGHVGDSRAYRVRDGEILQLSEDHTIVARLVRDGKLTETEAHTSPERNVLLRALGASESVEPQIWTQGQLLRDNDRFVLCSDGMHDLIDNNTILATVAEHAPAEACRLLIQMAREAGGHDNISVGVFMVSMVTNPPATTGRGTREVRIDGVQGSDT